MEYKLYYGEICANARAIVRNGGPGSLQKELKLTSKNVWKIVERKKPIKKTLRANTKPAKNKPKKIKFKAGDWFLVPLYDCKKWAVGLLARSSSSASIGYFWGPFSEKPTKPLVKDNLRPSNPVYVCQMGNLGLKTGEWPIIESETPWAPETWPNPYFIRYAPFVPSVLARFDDHDPLKEVETKRCSVTNKVKYWGSGLHGPGVIEKIFSRK